jgi:riboflavin biosynthesis pyrimidine reductase
MLALLRAVADAVVVGAGTVRKEPASVWTPESVFPDAADDFAALRRAMRRPARSLSVVVSGSGDIDLTLPAFADGAPILILTTARGSARLRGAPAHITVRELVDLEPAAIVRAAANESGGELILTEGGPTLLAQFVRDNVLDEIFLTVAPRIVGRSRTEPRLGIVDGVAFAPGQAREERLVSVKAAEDYLFLRFARR